MASEAGSDSSEEEILFTPRDRRTPKVPPKLMDYDVTSGKEQNGVNILMCCLDIMICIYAGKILLKCSQTGERFHANLAAISNDDGEELSKDDISPGLSVLVDVGGISYAAEVIEPEGMWILHPSRKCMCFNLVFRSKCMHGPFSQILSLI